MPYPLQRDSRLIVMEEGGFLSRLDVIDITLDKVSENFFDDIRSVVDLLQDPLRPLDDDAQSDMAYHLLIGDHDALLENMEDIFSSEIFRPCPQELVLLAHRLHRGAKPEHRVLKP